MTSEKLALYFSKDSIENELQSQHLWQWLNGLHDCGLEKTFKQIISSEYVQQDKSYILVDGILVFVCIRFKFIKEYVDLVQKLITSEKGMMIDLKSCLFNFLMKRLKTLSLEMERITTEYQVQLFLFLRYLMERGVYSIKEIWDSFQTSINSLCDIRYIFPEFSEIDEQIYIRSLGKLFPFQRTQLERMYSEEKDNIRTLFNEFEKPGTIAKAIINDDVDLLSSLITENDFQWDPGKCEISPLNTIHYSMDPRPPYDQRSTSPLLPVIAAAHGSIKCFKFCLLNMSNFNPEICVFPAIEGGSIDIIRILENKGARFNRAAKVAAEFYRNDILEWLFSRFATNPSKENLIANEALEGIGISNNIEALSFVIPFNPCFEYKKTGKAILHAAAEFGHIDLVKMLLSNKCINSSQYDSQKFTPLHYAALHGFTDICKVLLQNKAYINAKIADHRTPIFLAVENSELETVRLLLEDESCVPDICEHSISGFSPYLVALSNGDLEMAKLLVSTGKVYCGKIAYGNVNSLYLAVGHKDNKLIDFALSQEPLPKILNRNNPEGYSVLLSITSGNRYGYERLIKAGFEIEDFNPKIIDLYVSKACNYECNPSEALKMIEEILGISPKEILKKVARNRSHDDAFLWYESAIKQYGIPIRQYRIPIRKYGIPIKQYGIPINITIRKQ